MARPKTKHKRTRQHFVQADKIIGILPDITVFKWNDVIGDIRIHYLDSVKHSFQDRRDFSIESETEVIAVGSYAEYASVMSSLHICLNHSEDHFRSLMNAWDMFPSSREGSLIEHIERGFRWFVDLEIDLSTAEYSKQWDLLKLEFRWKELDHRDTVYIDLRNDMCFKRYVYDFRPQDFDARDFEPVRVEWDEVALDICKFPPTETGFTNNIINSIGREHKIWNLKSKVVS